MQATLSSAGYTTFGLMSRSPGAASMNIARSCDAMGTENHTLFAPLLCQNALQVGFEAEALHQRGQLRLAQGLAEL